MKQIDWERAWKDAQPGTMLSRCRVGDRDFSGYFGGIAEDYLAKVLAQEKFYRGIVGHLYREKFLRRGDDVLDVACGPGTYALHFAAKAGTVAALDPAEGMLAVLMREAERRGLANVRPVRSRWEEYEAAERYDLVFTALSPGITGPETFLKLERYSRRSCCYIGFGDGDNNELGSRLWELVIGEARKKKNGIDVTYPLNLLFSLGRRPNLRFFETAAPAREPCEEVIDSNVRWLGMFTTVGRKEKRKIRDYVLSLSRDGYYEHIARQSLVALYWDVPAGGASR